MDEIYAAQAAGAEEAQGQAAAETTKRIGFSILFSLGGKYILFDFPQKEGEKVCKRMRDVVNLS